MEKSLNERAQELLRKPLQERAEKLLDKSLNERADKLLESSLAEVRASVRKALEEKETEKAKCRKRKLIQPNKINLAITIPAVFLRRAGWQRGDKVVCEFGIDGNNSWIAFVKC